MTAKATNYMTHLDDAGLAAVHRFHTQLERAATRLEEVAAAMRDHAERVSTDRLGGLTMDGFDGPAIVPPLLTLGDNLPDFAAVSDEVLNDFLSGLGNPPLAFAVAAGRDAHEAFRRAAREQSAGQ